MIDKYIIKACEVIDRFCEAITNFFFKDDPKPKKKKNKNA